MNRERKIFAVMCALCACLSIRAIPASAQCFRFPVASSLADSTGASGAAGSEAEVVPQTDYGAWSAPEPGVRSVLSGIGDSQSRKIVHYSAVALSLGGAILCAAGIATVFAGAAHDADTSTIHGGALCVISGSVVSAVFAAIAGSTAAPTSPR